MIPPNPYAPPSSPPPAEGRAPLTELCLRGLLRNGAPLGKGRLLIFSAGLVISAGVFLIF